MHGDSSATGGRHLLINADDGVDPKETLVKKLIIAALVATVATTPVLAQNYNHDDRGRGRDRVEQVDRRVVHKTVVRNDDRRQTNRQYRRWQKGQRFDQRYAQNYRVIQAPRAYRLRDAPRGYRWVQSGNDAVLIGITSGIIAAIAANIIR